jgi:hypothetical protein
LAVVALLAVGIVLYEKSGPALAPVATLELAAMRGGMIATQPAREFDLILTDAAGGALRVQVVDAAGAEEWNENAVAGARGIEVKVRKALKPGTYFVRLYGPGGQMLHEYGFQVR